VTAAKNRSASEKDCPNNYQNSMPPKNPTLEIAGLCSQCQHARLIESNKGSVFILCELSKTDTGFAKYPRLPVLACPGYEPPEPARDEAVKNPM
jgi:hypothetical protein